MTKQKISYILLYMGCLSTARKTRIQTQITSLEAQLDVISTAITEGTAAGSYSLDTGEGKQMVKYRSLNALLDAQDRLQSAIDRLYGKLNGTGICNVNLRRYGA